MKRRPKIPSALILEIGDSQSGRPETTRTNGDDDELDGSAGTTQAHPPKLSANPIVAAIQRFLWRRGQAQITALDGNCDHEALRRLIDRVFDQQTLSEVGAMTIEAVLSGDGTFVQTVKKAIKEADHLCHRDREKALLTKCFQYVENKGWIDQIATESLRLPPEKIKTLLERDCNNGKKFEEHQWRRLRRACFLPKREAGR